MEWPQANRSQLNLQFIPVDVAEAAIANEQAPTQATLRTALSGGRLPSSSSIPRQGFKLGAAADRAIAAAADSAGAAKEGSPAAAAAGGEGAAGRPAILDRLKFSEDGGEGAGAAPAAAEAGTAKADAPAAAAAAPARARKPAEDEPPSLDDLFRKTEAKPHLYYLPLSDEQVAAKKARREAAAAAGAGGRSGGSGRAGDREPVGPAVMEGLGA